MWEIAWGKVGSKQLSDYLKHGWEPFAALRDPSGGNMDPQAVVVWVKKYQQN